MADEGMGFLKGHLGEPTPHVETVDGDDGDTRGKTGMGKVINGLDREEELALYQELRGAYWVHNTIRHLVAAGTIAASLYLSAQSLDIEMITYSVLALIVTVTYLKG